ncbi:MAG: hypothetical protein HS111_06880 [Kofleriaceae bacterium]|nr:hypothetical protein [Kofleriaceae bacterium]
MSELAFTKTGQRFVPPQEATRWLVTLLCDNRGTKTLYDERGAPLSIPMEATRADLRAAVKDRPGRYRLTATDANGVPIPEVPRAIVPIPDTEPDEDDARDDGEDTAGEVAAPTRFRNAAAVAATAPRAWQGATVTSPIGTWPALPVPVSLAGAEYLVGEALRGQFHVQTVQHTAKTEQLERCLDVLAQMAMAQANVINANAAGVAQMMSAAADLLRSSDASGMTRREPPPAPPPPAAPPPAPPTPPAPPPAFFYAMPRNAAYDDAGVEDDVEEESAEPAEPTPEEDFFSKTTELVTKAATALAPVAEIARMVTGAGGLGGLAGMFGGGAGGGDAPRNAAPDGADGADGADGTADVEAEAAAPDGVPAHLRTSHVIAILYGLGPKDGPLFRQYLKLMEPEERQLLTTHLCAMPLEEAEAFAAEKAAWFEERLAHARAARARKRAVIDIESHEVASVESSDVAPDGPCDAADAADTRGDDFAQEEPETQPETHDPDPDPLAPTHHQEDATTQHTPTPNVSTQPTNTTEDADLTRTSQPQPDAAPASSTMPTSAPAVPTTATAPQALTPAAPAPTPQAAPPAPREIVVTPAMDYHLKQIGLRLHPREVLQVQALMKQFSVVEHNAWITRLMQLDPERGSLDLRDELARRAGMPATAAPIAAPHVPAAPIAAPYAPNAAPPAPIAAPYAPIAAPRAPNAAPPPTPPTAAITPQLVAHLRQIAQYLQPHEVAFGQRLIMMASPAERGAWIARLMPLDPAQAATVIRAELARRGQS